MNIFTGNYGASGRSLSRRAFVRESTGGSVRVAVFRGAAGVTTVKHLPHTRATDAPRLQRPDVELCHHHSRRVLSWRQRQRRPHRVVVTKTACCLVFREQVTSSTRRRRSEAQTFTAEPRTAMKHQNELEPSPRILSIVQASITTSYIPPILTSIISTSNFPSPASPPAASLTHYNVVLKIITECKELRFQCKLEAFADLIAVFASCGFGGATHSRIQGSGHVCAGIR